MGGASADGSPRPDRPTPETLSHLLRRNDVKRGYTLQGVRINADAETVTAQLYVYGIASKCSYFDPMIEDYCSRLALHVRGQTEYNQFFDVVEGELTLFTKQMSG